MGVSRPASAGSVGMVYNLHRWGGPNKRNRRSPPRCAGVRGCASPGVWLRPGRARRAHLLQVRLGEGILGAPSHGCGSAFGARIRAHRTQPVQSCHQAAVASAQPHASHIAGHEPVEVAGAGQAVRLACPWGQRALDVVPKQRDLRISDVRGQGRPRAAQPRRIRQDSSLGGTQPEAPGQPGRRARRPGAGGPYVPCASR